MGSIGRGFHNRVRSDQFCQLNVAAHPERFRGWAKKASESDDAARFLLRLNSIEASGRGRLKSAPPTRAALRSVYGVG